MKARAEAVRVLYEAPTAHRRAARTVYVAPYQARLEALSITAFDRPMTVALNDNLAVVSRMMDGASVDNLGLSGPEPSIDQHREGMPDRSRTGSGPDRLPVRGHRRDDRIDVVTLNRVVSDPVGSDEPAGQTTVHDYEALSTSLLDSLRLHQAVAGLSTITGLDIHVLRPQACWTVVAITSIDQRQHDGSTVLTDKALVLGGSTDGSASRSKK